MHFAMYIYDVAYNENAYADCDWLSILLSTNHSVVTGNKNFSEKMYRAKRMI